MTIRGLFLQNLTVFQKAAFEFAPGINVLVGENGTGKSHVLKLMYAVQKANWRSARTRARPNRRSLLPLALNNDIAGVFRTETETAGPLRRRPFRGLTFAHLYRDSEGGGPFSFRIDKSGLTHLDGVSGGSMRPVFIPTRELMSVYPGFAEAIQNRELEFDDTYPDLVEALGLSPLKGAALAVNRRILSRVEMALGGREVKQKGRFYVKQNASGEIFKAHLVAEGLRKVATLARLIQNGRITLGTTLFWDEPEANLNPVLLLKVVDVLLALAGAGVQIFLASHDYLLTQQLSLHGEHRRKDTPPMRFFGLSVNAKTGAVDVTQADTLVGIRNNPILREHARQYDREVAAIQQDEEPA